MKTLYLTVKKGWLDLYIQGEKTVEYRAKSAWITSRLIDGKTGKPKHYDIVEFRDGYNANSRKIQMKYNGFYVAYSPATFTYSNNLWFEVKKGDYVIKLIKL